VGEAIGFDALDLTPRDGRRPQDARGAGLRVGSVDLLDFGNLMHVDAGKRKELIAQNVAYVKEIAATGAKNFFTVVIPVIRQERVRELCADARHVRPDRRGVHARGRVLAVEGWPGGPPYFASLVCTPETVRSFLKDSGPPRAQLRPVTPDPPGVDHVRFLKEFVAAREARPREGHRRGRRRAVRVRHQPATFAKPHGFGEWTWRYTIPGHGVARWNEIASILKTTGYSGVISVELEDEHFNGTEAGEQARLVHSLNFLKGCSFLVMRPLCG
jgi:hypothetical protein